MAAAMTSAPAITSPRPAGTAATTTVVNPSTPSPIIAPPLGTLRLRGMRSEQRHIQWADDVIDNEGMGKKSSKVCCIYHKIRAPDESSSDESSDSSSESDSDSEPDNSRARPVGGARHRAHRHRHHRQRRDDDQSGSNDEGDSGIGGVDRPPKRRARRPSPNAYERIPKYGKKKSEGSS